jgi:uncharacterized membrane protein
MSKLLKNEEKPFYFKVLTVGCLLLLLANWILAIVAYPSLPATIPSHFNARGEVDGYSSRATLFLLPAVATFSLLILLLVGPLKSKFSNLSTTVYSFPLQPMTEARLLKVVAFLTAILFLIIEVFLIQSAKTGKSPRHFYWVFILAGILVIYPFVEMALDKKKKT